MRILVSGGTGFIGSHTCVELISAGHEVIIFDNFYNSSPETVDHIETICGVRPKLYECDMLDEAALDRIFDENEIDAVIHFAGYKAVGESVAEPIKYFHNNITGTLCLLRSMVRHGVKKMIFSSSATVYGIPETVPIKEDAPLGVTNPYGRTKFMIEDILRDVCASDASWSVVLLRYFNPVGCHESGLLHENPKGIPNNLMPRILQAAKGEIEYLSVFGADYNTSDGTCVRDYIHVVDLAKGHVCAVDYASSHSGDVAVNLGTGTGYTVFELIKNFENETGIKVPYKVAERRPGDVEQCYADTSLAKELFGWSAKLGVADMCRDSWKGANI